MRQDLKISIRLKTSKYGLVETQAVPLVIKDGKYTIDSVVVYEKQGEDGDYLFKQQLYLERNR